MSIPGLLSLLLAGLITLIVWATMWTMWRLRTPPRRTYAWAVAKGRPGDPGELAEPRAFDRWTIDAADATIEVWDVAGDAPDGPAVILTPGWGDSRIGGLARLPAIARSASRVLLWDPPGLGDTPGRWPMGTREHEIVHALAGRIAPDAVRGVVLMGWSAGAGTSIVAAAQSHTLPIVGVIAEAPYRLPWTPARRVLRQIGAPWAVNGPLAFAMLGLRLGVGARWAGFDRAEHASRLRCPLLVLHGSADAVCPVEAGRAIAAAAQDGALRIVDGAGHNDLWTDTDFAAQSAKAVGDFLRALNAGVPREAATSARGSAGPAL